MTVNRIPADVADGGSQSLSVQLARRSASPAGAPWEPPRRHLCAGRDNLEPWQRHLGEHFPLGLPAEPGAFSLLKKKKVCFASVAGTEPSKYNLRKMSQPLKHG